MNKGLFYFILFFLLLGRFEAYSQEPLWKLASNFEKEGNYYEAIRIIKENITALNLEDKTKVLSMLDTNALHYFTENHIKFDLVYLDPPYALQQNEKIIGILDEKGLLTSSARIVVECLKEDTYADRIGDVEKYKEAIYGISKIVYYRKVNK